MLGDQAYDCKGKVVSMRVLENGNAELARFFKPDELFG